MLEEGGMIGCVKRGIGALIAASLRSRPLADDRAREVISGSSCSFTIPMWPMGASAMRASGRQDRDPQALGLRHEAGIDEPIATTATMLTCRISRWIEAVELHVEAFLGQRSAGSSWQKEPTPPKAAWVRPMVVSQSLRSAVPPPRFSNTHQSASACLIVFSTEADRGSTVRVANRR